MRVDFVDRYSRGSSPVHRLDARAKLVGTFAVVIAVVATPWRWWPLYLVEAAVALALFAVARLPWSYLAARLAAFLPFVLLLAGTIPLARGLREGWDLAGQLAAQSVISLAFMIVLVATTPFGDLLNALGWLRVPRVIISILAFMYRYIFVLSDEYEKMQRARRARTFWNSPWWEFPVLGHFVGVLFVRSFERGERIYAAMCARGWNGRMPGEDGE